MNGKAGGRVKRLSAFHRDRWDDNRDVTCDSVDVFGSEEFMLCIEHVNWRHVSIEVMRVRWGTVVAEARHKQALTCEHTHTHTHTHKEQEGWTRQKSLV